MGRDFTIWGKVRRSSYKPKKTGRYKNKDSEQADIRIKYCTRCRCCWEKDVGRDRISTSSNNILYYKGFVSYGKTRQICPQCSENEKLI